MQRLTSTIPDTRRHIRPRDVIVGRQPLFGNQWWSLNDFHWLPVVECIQFKLHALPVSEIFDRCDTSDVLRTSGLYNCYVKRAILISIRRAISRQLRTIPGNVTSILVLHESVT